MGFISKIKQKIAENYNRKLAEEAEAELAIKAEEKKERLELAQLAREEDRKLRVNSKEPYLEVVSQEWHPEYGLQMELDWNKAMIKYLEAMGITGANEEVIVHKYLHAISKDVQLEEVAENYLNIIDDDEDELENTNESNT